MSLGITITHQAIMYRNHLVSCVLCSHQMCTLFVISATIFHCQHQVVCICSRFVVMNLSCLTNTDTFSPIVSSSVWVSEAAAAVRLILLGEQQRCCNWLRVWDHGLLRLLNHCQKYCRACSTWLSDCFCWVAFSSSDMQLRQGATWAIRGAYVLNTHTQVLN